MGIRSVWITTVPSPFYRWLRRSLKEPCEYSSSHIYSGLRCPIQHLDKSSQLSPFQCGFRKNHSTQDAVTYFTDCIRKCIDKCCVTAAVFVDFRKAFNSVNHQLLLKKLPGYGIKNHELRWFKNYLTSRCHSVVYGSAKSAPQQIKCGLPQGPYFVRFCFRFTSMTCPTVYFRQRSYFMQMMLSFSTLTPISET